MPNRIIRDSARTSPTLAQLTGDEERFFWRLVTVADDYGRFEADPVIMRSLCFPRQADEISTAAVAAWFVRLSAVGLVRPYVIDGRPFGVFSTWEKQQRIRAKESRFPAPPDATTCPTPDVIGGHVTADDSTRQQAPTHVAVVVNEVVSGNGIEDGTEKEAGGASHPRNPLFLSDSAGKDTASARVASVVPDDDDGFDEFYAAYPRKKHPEQARKAWRKLGPDDRLRGEILAAIARQKTWPEWRKDGGQYIPHPATWLNARAWQDEPTEPVDGAGFVGSMGSLQRVAVRRFGGVPVPS